MYRGMNSIGQDNLQDNLILALSSSLNEQHTVNLLVKDIINWRWKMYRTTTFLHNIMMSKEYNYSSKNN